MIIEKIQSGYRIEHGEYTHYFNSLDDAKAYVGLAGMFAIEYDKLHKRKRKFFKPERFKQPIEFLIKEARDE